MHTENIITYTLIGNDRLNGSYSTRMSFPHQDRLRLNTVFELVSI